VANPRHQAVWRKVRNTCLMTVVMAFGGLAFPFIGFYLTIAVFESIIPLIVGEALWVVGWAYFASLHKAIRCPEGNHRFTGRSPMWPSRTCNYCGVALDLS
jgi:hypothetical protein